MRLLVIEGAFHLRGRGLLLWPLVRFDALPPPADLVSPHRHSSADRQPPLAPSVLSDRSNRRACRSAPPMPCLPRLFASCSHVSLTPVYNQSQCGIS
jgi:hypothetical protein